MGEAGTVLAILVMAAVTLATRLAGPMIMRVVPLSPRVERFLEALSAAVIAAIVASYLAQNGPREWVAVGLAAVAALGLGRAIWAMLAAMLAGAAWVALAGA